MKELYHLAKQYDSESSYDSDGWDENTFFHFEVRVASRARRTASWWPIWLVKVKIMAEELIYSR